MLPGNVFWVFLRPFVRFQSPPYSSGSYDSVKTEVGMSAEDLTSGRAQIIDEDDDEHDEHDDSDKINDAEGMDPERLKAFNVSRRRFLTSGALKRPKRDEKAQICSANVVGFEASSDFCCYLLEKITLSVADGGNKQTNKQPLCFHFRHLPLLLSPLSFHL